MAEDLRRLVVYREGKGLSTQDLVVLGAAEQAGGWQPFVFDDANRAAELIRSEASAVVTFSPFLRERVLPDNPLHVVTTVIRVQRIPWLRLLNAAPEGPDTGADKLGKVVYFREFDQAVLDVADWLGRQASRAKAS